MSSELSEILASVNNTKEHLYLDDPDRVKSYPPYIINRCLSGHVDSILFANAMNLNQHLDKRLQYDFLLNTLMLISSQIRLLGNVEFDLSSIREEIEIKISPPPSSCILYSTSEEILFSEVATFL